MNRLIAAVDQKLGIAKHGFLPWNIPEDIQYFRDMTKTHGGIVLVGRSTFEEFAQPLPDRTTYVLTHKTEPIEGVNLVHDLDQFLEDFNDKDVWIIGGAKVFEEVIEAGKADELYLTHIEADFGCDQFFPQYEDKFELIEKSERRKQNGFYFSYARYACKTT